MATFFALLFGILFGLIAGVILMSAVMLSDSNLRIFLENEAKELDLSYESKEL